MDTLKQTQQQQSSGPTETDTAYEWSYMRVAEGVTTNVVSAVIIGGLAILGGAVYAGWTLVLNALHTPSGIVGMLAFILLGAVLMLVILGVVIVAWIRGTSTATLAGIMIGAIVGAAIGAAIDSGKWKFDWVKAAMAQEQKKTTTTESEPSR
jgi:hypothetical protein